MKRNYELYLSEVWAIKSTRLVKIWTIGEVFLERRECSNCTTGDLLSVSCQRLQVLRVIKVPQKEIGEAYDSPGQIKIRFTGLKNKLK